MSRVAHVKLANSAPESATIRSKIWLATSRRAPV
jgi:hypothetical protein